MLEKGRAGRQVDLGSQVEDIQLVQGNRLVDRLVTEQFRGQLHL